VRIGPARAAARHTFFHPSAGGSSLLGRFLRRILAALANAFNLHSLALGHLLELGAIAALVIGAVALAARLAPRRRPAGRVAEAAAPQTVYAAARAAALGMADSDPREALRLLYAAALAELNRRRGWRPLGGATPEAVALAECTQLFERAVYGHAPVAPDDVRRADGLAEAMLA
jgi:hypothetical protein